jgi:hypothetical protein
MEVNLVIDSRSKHDDSASNSDSAPKSSNPLP